MGSINWRIVAVLCLISVFIICSFTSSILSAALESTDSILLKYEVKDVFVGKLKHIIQIINPTSHNVSEGKLFVPLIRNETARHYVILYNISSSIGQPTFSNDTSGNNYACWSNVIIQGDQTFTVEINYYIVSFSIRYLTNSGLMADYNESSELYKKYTQPEELIQSNNSEIISKAQNITNGENDMHEKVSKIYNFVIKHLRYAAQEDERGALWALKHGVGDCSEYSYLFVALCRAAGIPARVQAGFAFHRMRETLEDGHMWAEYYLEDYGWIPLDATWQLSDAMDCKHFSSIQSIPEVIPYANYFFNYTIGPRPGQLDEKQTVFLEPCSANVFGEGSFAEKAVKTVSKIKQAKFIFSLAKVFGATLIFPSEAEKAKQTLLESQISLQNAIDLWKTLPQLAQPNIFEALERAEEAVQYTWMLIAKVFTVFIGIATVILLIALVRFLKRSQVK